MDLIKDTTFIPELFCCLTVCKVFISNSLLKLTDLSFNFTTYLAKTLKSRQKLLPSHSDVHSPKYLKCYTCLKYTAVKSRQTKNMK